MQMVYASGADCHRRQKNGLVQDVMNLTKIHEVLHYRETQRLINQYSMNVLNKLNKLRYKP